MVDAVTNNYSLVQPTQGGDLNIWGTTLNNGTINAIDASLGSNLAVSITSSDVSLTTAQFQNAIFICSGVLTGNKNLIIPLSPNSATVACGGRFVVVNNTTGAFNLTVKTAASGSTGVTVPQGFTAFLYSDGTNVGYCDNGLPAYALASNGNPNGVLAGTAASATTNASLAFDYVNTILYVCTTTGTTLTAVWTNIVATGAALPSPQGYLTPTSGVPIITTGYGAGEGNAAATSIFYTPYTGDWTPIHNGNLLIAYKFTEMQLVLSSSQAANNIYDVFLAYNGGTPVIGTGPSWASGTGGNITAGSCARGTSTGGTALQRFTGFLTNAASMSLIWNTGGGNNTITVPINQGIYLGTIYIDGSAGQVSCNRTYGQSRKWGIWNAFNRVPIYLKAGDNSSNWGYNLTTPFRPANGNTANSIAVLSGLAEEVYQTRYNNAFTTNGGAPSIGIGWNATAAASGFVGIVVGNNVLISAQAVYDASPSLGINVVTALEKGGSNSSISGTEAGMLLEAYWRG